MAGINFDCLNELGSDILSTAWYILQIAQIPPSSHKG